MLVPKILRPSYVLLRRLANSAPKKRKRLSEAVGVKVRQSRRSERFLEDGPDRARAAPRSTI